LATLREGTPESALPNPIQEITMTHPRRLLTAAIAALCLGASAGATAASGETTDLWWDPAESGWGANIVQQGDVAFITLFVYGADGRPTWYFASEAREFARDTDLRPAFRGTLYKAAGPWLGGAFDPSKVAIQPVGQALIEPRPGGRLYLEYTAEGVTVRRTLVRQSFATPIVGKRYLGSFNLRASRGGVPAEFTRFGAEVNLEIEAGELRMRVQGDDGTCHYRGAYASAGRYASASGTVDCEGGTTGTFAITELELTRHGLSGYLRVDGPDAIRTGRFAAASY
jgi:hypothetical protein